MCSGLHTFSFFFFKEIFFFNFRDIALCCSRQNDKSNGKRIVLLLTKVHSQYRSRIFIFHYSPKFWSVNSFCSSAYLYPALNSYDIWAVYNKPNYTKAVLSHTERLHSFLFLQIQNPIYTRVARVVKHRSRHARVCPVNYWKFTASLQEDLGASLYAETRRKR